MDKWLANLQKVTVVTAPAATKADPAVEPIFSDLCKISDDGPDVPETGQVYADDVATAEIPIPAIDDLFSKAAPFHIPQISEPHPDGEEFERRPDLPDVLWKHHWKDGQLQKSECWDPQLPGGGYLLVEKGRDPSRDGRHDATAVFANVQELLRQLDDAWAELLGSHYPETKPDVDSKKKAAASSDGAPLRKAAVAGTMTSLFAQLRGDCLGNEAELLEKALAALDVTAFTELTTGIIARLKRQRAA
jgi:hypothetical protein